MQAFFHKKNVLSFHRGKNTAVKNIALAHILLQLLSLSL